jgi:eukaryotic-like serine/threonine-protein kinase
VEQALAGSPLYMSPEQLRGEETGPASDLYSLGIVLYLLLCGQPPYDARDTKTLFQQIKRLPPVPLTAQRPDLPEPLCALVMRLLSKNPADRMQNGLQLSQDSLKQLAFFKAFKSRELGELIDASETVTFKSGAAIIREGETDNALYILLMGLAEVRKNGQLIAVLEKGDCFGEIGFLYAVQRTASVVATTDAMVLKVNAQLLEQMSPDCQLRYYKIFCENLILRLTLTTEKAAKLLPKSDIALDFILP